MFVRLSLSSMLAQPQRSIVSQRNLMATLPFHGATKTSRELAIGSTYTFNIRPNHLGMALILSSSSPCRIVVKSKNSLEGKVILDATSTVHVFHRKLPADEKLNLENVYSVEVYNVSEEVIKYACHHT